MAKPRSPRLPRRQPFSKLATERLRRGITVKQMCEKTGISEAQYWRLENLRLKQPSVRLYANCAIALDMEIQELLDDELTAWFPFDYSQAAEPPDPEWYFEHSYFARPNIGPMKPPGPE